MKKNNKKGFTLAELLIVVAIIAILVAIMIPMFTSSRDKAAAAADAANIRSYLAEKTVQALTNNDTSLSLTQTELNNQMKNGSSADYSTAGQIKVTKGTFTEGVIVYYDSDVTISGS